MLNFFENVKQKYEGSKTKYYLAYKQGTSYMYNPK